VEEEKKRGDEGEAAGQKAAEREETMQKGPDSGSVGTDASAEKKRAVTPRKAMAGVEQKGAKKAGKKGPPDNSSFVDRLEAAAGPEVAKGGETQRKVSGSSGGSPTATGGWKRVTVAKGPARQRAKARLGQKVAKKASKEGAHNNSSVRAGATGEGKAAAASRAGAGQKKKAAQEPKLAEKAAVERDRVRRQTRAEHPKYRERGSSEEKTDSGAEGVARKRENRRVIGSPRSVARHGQRTIGTSRPGSTKDRKTGHEGKQGAAAIWKAAPKATVKPTGPATAGMPRFDLADWRQQELIREWRQTEYGSGASAMMTIVEAMLHEGVVGGSPDGEREFERRVEAFEVLRSQAADVVTGGARRGGLTEYGRGAIAMIRIVEAMLTEGVLERPEGEAGLEYRRRVNAFKEK
jgi:hypothetical protein